MKLQLLLLFLGKKPELGMISSLAAMVLTFIESTLPYIQYGSAIVFFLIGVLTLYGLIKKTFYDPDPE